MTHDSPGESASDLHAKSKCSTRLPPRAWISEQFLRLERPLLNFVARRLRVTDRFDLAHDIVQEAFVKLCSQPWPHIESHATAWLYRTCRNRAIDLARREVRMNTMHREVDMTALGDRRAGGPEEAAKQAEEMAQVQCSLGNLPDRQQELLRLRLQDGLSYKQISEVTGLSTSNVGYLIHQAISQLRKQLAAPAP